MPATGPVDASGDGSLPRNRPATRFASMLVDCRRAAGLTQGELAERSGLSVRAIRELEHGRVRVPQRESVKALVAALGLDGVAARALERAAPPDRTAAAGRAAVAAAGVCALPSGVPDFTGRTGEVAWLRGLMGRVSDAPSTVVVVSGQGGIGKTALAVRAGHEFAAGFPDGILHVDLRGTDQQPADPGQVLGSFLRALGLPEGEIPATVADRAARFRALLFRRRALLVLDNAADEAQVRPLLPAGPSCFVLVTSRSVLAGLETPHRLQLDVFTPLDAVALLTEIIGDRTGAEPAAAAEVARLCGYLPLALRIAGNWLTSQPGSDVANLAERLRDEQDRLRVLEVGDLQVRAAFALSRAQASPAAQAVFRRLSLVPGSDFGTGIAAVLAGSSDLAAETVLDELADASLILLAPTAGRYRLHDLVRLFAAERLGEEEDEAARGRTEDRLLDWLLATATRAGEVFFPNDEEKTAQPAPPVTTGVEAGRWLEEEWSNWMGAVRRAVALERYGGVCVLARAMRWYFDAVGGLTADWRELCELAVESARRLGDLSLQARHLNDLGVGEGRFARRLDEAAECFRQALAAAEQAGDRREEGWALSGLAWVHAGSGRFTEALDYSEQSLVAFRAAEFRVGEALVLHSLGATLGRSGRSEESVAYQRQALVALREVGYRAGEGTALQTLGRTLAALGRLTEAADCLQRAVAIHHAEGHLWREGTARRYLGSVLHDLGRFEEAAGHHRRAVAVFAGAGGSYYRAKALCALGITVLELGDERAREYLREALEIYEQLRLPQAEGVRRLLAGLETIPEPGAAR